jgi:hypothetical protein
MNCPTPQKSAFASESAARRVRASRISKGNRVRIYRCACGAWHLSVARRVAA